MFLLEVFWLDFVFFPHLAVTHVEGAEMFQLLIGAATLLLFDSVVYVPDSNVNLMRRMDASVSDEWNRSQ
ncbi:hypothetical protein O6P43_017755 [Quillaja saponaria]|uniref:Uncharacterized protein n=1 Tax=Quillaja saponaria TaxID=32244 RepID=A0AAD7PP98_QUISA|nr:hypothetical protein O6P43_017755 [Quillaja saponaria]